MRIRVLAAVATAITTAALTVPGPAAASGPDGPCAAGEDNSGQITSVQNNGGGSITVSAWLRYCSPSSTWEFSGLPAFGVHRTVAGDALDADVAGAAFSTARGYQEVTRTLRLSTANVTDVCVHPGECPCTAGLCGPTRTGQVCGSPSARPMITGSACSGMYPRTRTRVAGTVGAVRTRRRWAAAKARA